MRNGFIYLLSASHAVADLSPGALPAVLPFFALHYGLSYTEIAGLVFASSCLSSAVQPVFGLMADKTNQSWFMGLGVLLTGISLGLTGWISDYWLIFAAIVVMGTGSSIFHPQAARYVNFISGAKKSTGIGMFSVGGNAGFGLGPLLAVWVIGIWGLKGVGIFALLSLLFGTALLAMGPKLEREAAALHKAENTKLHKSDSDAKNDWKSFCRLTLVIIGRSVVFCSISAFLPLYCISKFGITEAVAGTTLSVFAFGCTIMTLVGGWLGDRIGLIQTLRLGSLVLIPSVAGICVCPSIGWMFALLLIISFGINVTYPSFVVLGQTYLAKNVGFASGITLGLSFSVGGMVVPVLGKVADIYSLDTVMVILIALSAFCAAGAFLLKEKAGERKAPRKN